MFVDTVQLPDTCAFHARAYLRQPDKRLTEIKAQKTRFCLSASLLKAENVKLEKRYKYKLETSLIRITKHIKEINISEKNF